MQNINLSVIVISYNTAQLTLQCLTSLTFQLQKEKNTNSEIIIVDNASTDSSVSVIREFTKKSKIPITLITNIKNVGYGVANNQGVSKAHGKYILLLNSDTVLEEISFENILDYLKTNSSVGILSVTVRFPHGPIDPASHRGFPTIWRSFCYFSNLEKLSPIHPIFAKLFGGYHLTDRDLTKIHEIDCPTGAFFLIPASVFNEVKGFDTDFFMYGEDLDLAYRVKEKGYKVIYYPLYTILHLKHQSGLKADTQTKKMTKYHFYHSMKLFYKKHYAMHYPAIINNFIYFAIDLKSKF